MAVVASHSKIVCKITAGGELGAGDAVTHLSDDFLS